MSITKDDLDQALDQAIAGSEARIKTELRAEMADMKAELRAEMATGEARLHAHIDQAAKHSANVIIESVRSQIAALDDKYRDVIPEQRALRADLDAHLNAPGLHRAPRRSR